MIDPALKVYPGSVEVTPIDEISPPPAMPLSAALLRSHCHALTSDDDVLAFYQRAAVAGWEQYVDKTLLARPHVWSLYDFNRQGTFGMRLPKGKTQSIERIDYTSGGATVTLYGPSSVVSPTAEDFHENLLGENGGLITPISTWPSIDTGLPSAVFVYYTAGYEEGAVPYDIQEILLFIVSTLFENRGAADWQGEATIKMKIFEILSGILGQHHEPSFA